MIKTNIPTFLDYALAQKIRGMEGVIVIEYVRHATD